MNGGDDPAPGLFGRRRELEVLGGVLGEARRGRSAVLVVRGEAGIGKTALLDHAVAQADDLQVINVGGAESEAELAFAGVHQVCAPLLDRLDRLPPPQSAALKTALALAEGPPPDRFLVGLAVLTLLTDAAAKHPLVCVIDDAQWLDSASVQTLSIVARRLRADPVAMVFAVREGEQNPDVAGLERLPELSITGLDDSDSRTLLATTMPGPMDERVRERILAEARGNPLALREFPRMANLPAFTGGFGVAGHGRPLSRRIERSFAARVSALPADTRLLLLIAAADPVGETAVLWRAAALLGIPEAAAAPAETAELITVGGRVRFRHPLIRSAVYEAGGSADRRRVHEALADAIDPVDVEHRAWQRGRAATGPDEAIAAELERVAERARARGGVAAASAFLADAAELTPDPVERARRALAAARAKLDAGAPDAALALLAYAQAAPPDLMRQAQTELLRSQIAFAMHRGRDAPALLLAAAEHLRELDPPLARETYLEALMAAVFAGRLVWAEDSAPAGMARAARSAPPAPDPPRAVDLLLDGLVLRFTEGYAAAAPALMRAVRQFLRDSDAGVAGLRWYGLVGRIALDLWDQQSWDDLAARQVQVLREQGVLTLLPVALAYRAGVCVHAGRFDEAAALLEESGAISQATGAPPPLYIEPVLAAYRGQEERALHLVRTSLHSATVRGEGRVIPIVQYAAAVLHNSLGQYREALAATDWAVEHDDIGMYGYGLGERVEAAARCGETAIAMEATGKLAERADAAGTEMALGVVARSRALVAQGAEADGLYRAAIGHLERSKVGVLQARAQLLYGEWLRRERRQGEAAEQLRQARDTFRRVGAEGFAERARRELVAAGVVVQAPRASAAHQLTGQETTIAQLAAEGHTNSGIAAQLFLSARTVEWHMGKIFGKLGIASRRQLKAALAERNGRPGLS
ncbi:AAA family ATPase [Amycolatopsis sp. FDAARGOS 1241]|uniref:ATP-binding protein n=1 Tax=Amycolatopsis sp. FDAARGOS 1241 TaxID=2778070 RepID=UPI0019529ADC|nr:LuxR family transcriptional regulator [Amycolatopsis sp. FDAARGOS 1241]QRP42742.1 AAA family ATPase [Amycolatopsis sp. FDAARGOS 1241]